jgi:hypothetical protein
MSIEAAGTPTMQIFTQSMMKGGLLKTHDTSHVFLFAAPRCPHSDIVLWLLNNRHLLLFLCCCSS